MSIPRLGGLPSFTGGSAGGSTAALATTGTFGVREVRQLDSREEPWSAISQLVSGALGDAFFGLGASSQTFANESGVSTASFFEDLGALGGSSSFDLSFDSFGSQQIKPTPTRSDIACVGLSGAAPFSDLLSSFEPPIVFEEGSRLAIPIDKARNELLDARETSETALQYAEPPPSHSDIQESGPRGRGDEVPQEVESVGSDRETTDSEVSSEQETSTEDDQPLKKAKHGKKKPGAIRPCRERTRQGKSLFLEQKSGKILNPDEQELLGAYLQKCALERERVNRYNAKLRAKAAQEGEGAPKICRRSRQEAQQGRALLREEESGRILTPDEQELVGIYKRQLALNNQYKETHLAKRGAEGSRAKPRAERAQEEEGAPRTLAEKTRKGRALHQQARESGKALTPDEQELVDVYRNRCAAHNERMKKHRAKRKAEES